MRGGSGGNGGGTGGGGCPRDELGGTGGADRGCAVPEQWSAGDATAPGDERGGRAWAVD